MALAAPKIDSRTYGKEVTQLGMGFSQAEVLPIGLQESSSKAPMATTLNLATQLASAEFWYVHSEGGTFGPFTPSQMDELENQGRLGPQTMVVPAGDTNWVALASLLSAQQTIRTPTSAELCAMVGVAPPASTNSD
jgi:hypothetical protein